MVPSTATIATNITASPRGCTVDVFFSVPIIGIAVNSLLLLEGIGKPLT